MASVFFYSWGAPRFIFVILITTTLDFYLVKLMAAAQTVSTRKLLLIVSLSLNLGLLFYFKYCNFFVANINQVLSATGAGQLAWLNVILPIGISFYTFESVTYVVDVYRKEHKPLSNFLQYQLYILLFPKLIAGPIIRFSEISDQITGRFSSYNPDLILSGFYRFGLGLAKKVFIANTMALMADKVFSSSISELSVADCWIGALAYTFQIYFDFSGYSDMAIGLGKMFGFRFPENFNNPYTSKSVTEFWRRWHITLGNWMKNYLYIPLGGNKVNSVHRLYFNLWLVFILSGFWHGAAWTFVFWGVYYGFWLVIERVFLGAYLKKLGNFAVLLTFLIVVVGWVFFRSDSLSFAFIFVKKMFSFSCGGGILSALDFKIRFFFALSVLFSFFVILPYGQQIQNYFYNRENKTSVAHYLVATCVLVLFVLSVSSVTSNDFNPFIYFRF
ncbi:MAG: putative rane protein involved in D-alanine export [Bacteroidetes bacterium]|nr:putative rane protein involved in D-alanine export [Bacteroidota bacterium]